MTQLQARQIAFAGVAACLIGFLPTGVASANAMSDDDARQIFILADKVNNITADIIVNSDSIIINNPQSDATVVAICLSNLENNLSGIRGDLEEAGSLAAVASQMRDQTDEAMALARMRIPVRGVLQRAATARAAINATMGGCSPGATVEAKGQAILNLLDEVVSRLQPIAQRLGIRE